MQVSNPTTTDLPRPEAAAASPSPLAEITVQQLPPDLPEGMFACEKEISEAEDTKDTDAAYLSSDCKKDPDESNLNRRIEQILKLLLAFELSVEVPIEDTLRELMKLYSAILDAVLKLSSPEKQHAYLYLLDSNIVRILDQYSALVAPSFKGFLNQFASPELMQAFRNSFFINVTGRSLSTDEFMMLDSEAQRPAARTAAGGSDTVRGFVYRPPEKNSAALRTSFAFNAKSIMEHDYPIPLNTAGALREKAPLHSQKDTPLFTIKELQAIEAFLKENTAPAAFLNGRGTAAKNNEFIGFTAAYTRLKANVFLDAAKIGESLRVELSQSADRMTQSYILQALSKTDTAAAPYHALSQDSVPKSDYSAVYKIYYYILTAYQKEKSSGDALSAGLRYAYNTFINKGTEQNSPSEAYLLRHGFFFQDNGDRISDRKKGWSLLKKNWSRFAESLPASPENRQEIDRSFYSPWGPLVSPLEPAYKPGFKSAILLGGALITAILVVMALFQP